jgi:tyrosine ammonia-lyase
MHLPTDALAPADTLELGSAPLKPADVAAVADARAAVVLSPAACAAVERSRGWLEAAVAEGQLIYGVTTGYGPLATRHICPEQSADLQRNLVYHLASGVGAPLSPRQTRAIMLARANSLAQGHSAIRLSSLRLLLGCVNADVLPLIPRMGTVGASGDLTPLAHLTRGLMGEGRVLFRGEMRSAAEALRAAGLEPLAPTHKEGLALVNGTSAMTGIAALNAVDARTALELSLRLTVLYAELLRGRSGAWDPRLATVRPHPGQSEVTDRLRELAASSLRLRAPAVEHTTARDGAVARHAEALQDPYTIRCAPQVYGAVMDVLSFHEQVVATELNAVTDNPVFFGDGVVHGGNFYGQHVAFASDALMTALVKMAVVAERRIARITDEAQNGGLPPFLQARQPGLQSGFMGAQVTATALVAEMRAKAVPASVQSIPTNANNQDVVSLGTIAARKAAEMLDHLFDVLAIEAMILVQGFELRGGAGFATSSVALARQVRKDVAPLVQDRPLADDIANLSGALRGQTFP